MARRESPVEQFPGHIILPDFLNVRQVRVFEDAYFGDPNEAKQKGKRVFISVEDERILPVILDIVQEWHLENMPEKPTIETFPMTPVSVGHALISWISKELYKLYVGEVKDPNG